MDGEITEWKQALSYYVTTYSVVCKCFHVMILLRMSTEEKSNEMGVDPQTPRLIVIVGWGFQRVVALNRITLRQGRHGACLAEGITGSITDCWRNLKVCASWQESNPCHFHYGSLDPGILFPSCIYSAERFTSKTSFNSMNELCHPSSDAKIHQLRSNKA